MRTRSFAIGVVVSLTLVAPRVQAQRVRECGGAVQANYRWPQKTRPGLPAGRTPTTVTVDEMLQWQPLALTKADWCAPRQDKELQTYTVVGWVRVVRKEMADGDWHIELTQQADSPPTRCVVVEIPAPNYDPRYATARQRLAQWIPDEQIGAHHAVRQPVQLRFTGPAFFDGIHVTTGGHGNCNDQPGGYWEIHPVEDVARP